MGFALAFRGLPCLGRSRTPDPGQRSPRCPGIWLGAQIAWLTQGVLGSRRAISVGPADVRGLVPAVLALDLAVRHAVDRRERLGLYLDCVITFLAIATVVTLLFGYLVSDQDSSRGPCS